MMRYFFWGIFLLAVEPVFSQLPAKWAPEGMVEVAERYYIDADEVTNADWKAYLAWVAEQQDRQPEAYRMALPDTTVWRQTGKPPWPYESTNFSHPSFAQYPVVGVSHEQATSFCQWKGAQAREVLKSAGYKEWRGFDCRLPSQAEWAVAARLNASKRAKTALKKKYKNAYPYNLRHVPAGRKKKVASPAPARSYPEGKLGLYNLYGNVAEMIKEPPGLAMGGGFIHDQQEAFGEAKPYEGPAYWLGFRCVCEIGSLQEASLKD